MTRNRRPSGLPEGRILGPIYGPRETDLDRRVGNQHAGHLRVRRFLLGASAVVGALVLVVAVTAGSTSASGLAALVLAPLLLFLAGAHVAVVVTRPKPRRAPPDDS